MSVPFVTARVDVVCSGGPSATATSVMFIVDHPMLACDLSGLGLTAQAAQGRFSENKGLSTNLIPARQANSPVVGTVTTTSPSPTRSRPVFVPTVVALGTRTREPVLWKPMARTVRFGFAYTLTEAKLVPAAVAAATCGECKILSFIALDKRGRVGAASSSQSFPFAVATSSGNQVRSVEKVTPR